MNISSNFFRKILIPLEIFICINCIFGGLGLILFNGLGIPLSFLSDSPFNSFLIPGLILGILLGGLFLISSIFGIRKIHYFPEMSAASGFGLLIWVFTEIYLIKEFSFLQILIFALGILVLILTFFYLKTLKI